MNGRRTSVFENGLIWFAGFIIYRMLMRVDIVVGNTLPDMVITIILCVLADQLFKNKAAK